MTGSQSMQTTPCKRTYRTFIKEKAAERLSLASQIKMVEDKLNNNERVVVAKASSEITKDSY